MKFDLRELNEDNVKLKNSHEEIMNLIGGDLTGLAEDIGDAEVQAMQVADGEGMQRRRGTRSLGYAVACSDLPCGAGELPA